jgi:hypothetical protein
VAYNMLVILFWLYFPFGSESGVAPFRDRFSVLHSVALLEGVATAPLSFGCSLSYVRELICRQGACIWALDSEIGPLFLEHVWGRPERHPTSSDLVLLSL